MTGKHNVVADALSRQPDLAAADVEEDVAQSAAVVGMTHGHAGWG